MRQACKISTLVFTIFGVAFFALGILNRTWPKAEATISQGGVSYLQAVQSFGKAPSKTYLDVIFIIKNSSRRDVHILGSEINCGRYGCASVKNGELPITVQPGERREVRVEVHTVTPGDFVQELAIFTDCPGQLKLPLTVTGKIVAPTDDLK